MSRLDSYAQGGGSTGWRKTGPWFSTRLEGEPGSFRRNPNQERGRSVGTPGEEDSLKSIEKAKCDQKKKKTFETELIFSPLVGGRAELKFGMGDRASRQAFTRLKRPEAFLLRM